MRHIDSKFIKRKKIDFFQYQRFIIIINFSYIYTFIIYKLLLLYMHKNKLFFNDNFKFFLKLLFKVFIIQNINPS